MTGVARSEVFLEQLWLTDFRSYASAEVSFDRGVTALLGANGEGKTSVLEAVAYLATLQSFRGAPAEAMVRLGAPRATVRAEGTSNDRRLLIEAEITPSGRGRVQVNRQRLARARDLLGAIRVTVFSPEDLALVKGGPAERRRYLDDVLVSIHPRHDALRLDLDRILRQRNALLRQAAGRLTPEIEITLDVWDAKLVEVGEALGAARAALVERLGPRVAEAYGQVASQPATVSARYEAAWQAEGLAATVRAARSEELRRGVSLVGPHRDDLVLAIRGLPARTHASQGEQRSLALALRLGAHAEVMSAVGDAPVLLLDDVFSELDLDRSEALLTHLPAAQTVLTSASGLPPGARPDRVLYLRGGRISGSPPAPESSARS